MLCTAQLLKVGRSLSSPGVFDPEGQRGFDRNGAEMFGYAVCRVFFVMVKKMNCPQCYRDKYFSFCNQERLVDSSRKPGGSIQQIKESVGTSTRSFLGQTSQKAKQ